VDLDRYVIVPLFDAIPCHTCGKVGGWWINGPGVPSVTLPCCCNAADSKVIARALAVARVYDDWKVNADARADLYRRGVARARLVARPLDYMAECPT
jgi:hypothetical protein